MSNTQSINKHDVDTYILAIHQNIKLLSNFVDWNNGVDSKEWHEQLFQFVSLLEAYTHKAYDHITSANIVDCN